jgi:hypothetical protein
MDTTISCTAAGLRPPRCLRALRWPFDAETDAECDLLPPLRGVSSSRTVFDPVICSEALDADRVRFFGRLQTNIDQSAFRLCGGGDLRVIISALPFLPSARSSFPIINSFSIPIDSSTSRGAPIMRSSLGGSGLDDLFKTLIECGIAAIHRVTPFGWF